MKQKSIHVTVALCVFIISAFASQSPTLKDQEESSEFTVIAPTDWASLSSIELMDDDCDPEKKSYSCIDSLTKPNTTEEARGSVVVSECYNGSLGSKVLTAYKPCYPAIAKSANTSGSVDVLVVVDEAGSVIWARAMKGHPLLQAAAVKAACHWRFEPELCGGVRHKVNRMITFSFTLTK